MTIIFDFGGVLTIHRKALLEIWWPLVQKHKIKVSFRELKRILNSHTPEGKKAFGKIIPKAVEEEALSQIRLKREVPALMRYLKKRKHRAGILSNGSVAWMRRLERKFALDKFFRPIIVSEQYKVRKPNAKLYKIFMREADVKPDECCFIDNKIENLRTAHKLGMKTVLFGPNRRPEWCDYSAQSLNELKKIF